MKQLLRLAYILCFLFLQTQLSANTVIVKGTVTDSANRPVANRTVKIYSTDSINGGCILSHTVVTNPNGYYKDTLRCNGDIRKLVIMVENCNGNKISYEVTVGLNSLIEKNFIICTPQTTTVYCKAAFSYVSLATGVKFNAAGSATVSGDSIISRTWTFGDSSAPLTGNRFDPTHAYTKPGIYKVCLTIKTKRGCESTYCETVVYTPASNDCRVEAIFSTEKLATKKFRFNSAQSNTLAGDSIFQRIWKFGDGSSLDGNQKNPLKEYKDTGVYNVCLIIKTVKGCEKQYCFTLKVTDTVPGTDPNNANCKAQFSFTKQGTTVKFSSFNSYAPVGDSIISRTWIWGDTTAQLTGNRFDPSHQYAKAGKYTVCLYIKTKKGCENRICVEIKVEDTTVAVPVNCKAFFTYSIKDSTIRFNSEGSKGSSDKDSIISRTWYYSDNSNSVSLSGNVVNPSYQYSKPGTYTVYLLIKTKSGCESKFSLQVVIPAAPVPDNCKAFFTYSIKDSTIYFNSVGSKGTSSDDSIISRTWYYSDSSTSVSLGGNIITPSYKYTKPGTYMVYLLIKTKKGCENKFSLPVVIPAPPAPATCKAYFTFILQDKAIKFNSRESKAAGEKDSIISRTWLFGDSTVPMQGNSIDPIHNYTKAGKYTVTLYIKTKSGCESKYTATLTINTVNCPVEVSFTAERISLKKIQFNSSLSKAQPGDSIIQRNWKFGDNTILSGNETKPVKEFSLLGIYNTCLQVRTLNGCEAQVCKQMVVQDTINTPQSSVDYIKIISINPNPVITRMMTTIYSRNSNVEAEISVYDIYGTRKLTVKKLLLQGNNMVEIGCESLYHGPYFLKVTSRNGKDSKAFYKL